MKYAHRLGCLSGIVDEEILDLFECARGEFGEVGGFGGPAAVAIVGKGHARRAIEVGNRRHIAIEIVGVGRDNPARVGPRGHLAQVRQRVGDLTPVGIGLRDNGPGCLVIGLVPSCRLHKEARRL